MIYRRRRFELALLVLAAALVPRAGALGAAEDSTIGTRATFTAPEHAAASFRSIDRIFFTRPVPRSGPVTPLEPTLDLVVVKTSAWPVAWDDAKEAESYGFFDAVRAAVKKR